MLLLINNLCGEYDASTPEGRGANAASNLMSYFIKGKERAKQNAEKLLRKEITLKESLINPEIEKFSKAYIPYTEVNEETGDINIEYGMAFVSVYIKTLSNGKSDSIPAKTLGPIGEIIDQIDKTGTITKSKLLAWFIFQDCVDIYNGILTPQEAAKAFLWAKNDSSFVIEKLTEIYTKLNLKEKEEKFSFPEPAKR